MADQEYKVKISLDGAQQAASGAQKVDSAIGGIGKSALAAGAAMFATGGIVAGLQKITELSAQVTRVEKVGAAFDSLSIKNKMAADTMARLRVATRGAVSDFELMKSANNIMMFGITDTTAGMEEMITISRRLGQAVGLDTTAALESLVIGMARQSKLMLDNLNIIVDMDTAYRNYAQQIGKAADQLTDLEKKTAFNEEAMKKAREKVMELGDDVEGAGDKIAQLATEWKNLKDSMGWIVDLAASTVDSFRTVQKEVNWLSDAISDSFVGSMWESWRVWNLQYAAIKENDGAFTQLISTHKNAVKSTTDSTDATAKSAEAIEKEAAAAKKAYEDYVSREVLKDEIAARMAEREKGRMAEFARLSADAHQNARDTAAWEEQQRQDRDSAMSDMAARYKEYGDRETKAAKDAARTKRELVEDGVAYSIGGMAALNAAMKGNATATKRLAQAEAITSTYLAANRALANPPGPPWTIPMMLGTISIGMGNVAKIQGQSYREGGVIEGAGGPRQDNRQVNVSNGESILNAEATARLGRDGIDRLNGGGGAGITLNFNGPFIGTESFVRDTVLPMLEAKLNRRLA